jgi:hypothetical protein
MQAPGVQAYQILVHDGHSHERRGELKKRLPDHVSEIEQERVKYLTLIHSQLTEWFLIWTRVHDLPPEDRSLDTDSCWSISISTPDPILRKTFRTLGAKEENFKTLNFFDLYCTVTEIDCVHAWSSLMGFFLSTRGEIFPMVFFCDAVSSALSNEVCWRSLRLSRVTN